MGLLSDVLTEVDRFGQVSRNLLKGQVGGAARQATQLGLNAFDAFLPGDWFANDIAREEDVVDGSDLLGIDREKSPIWAGVTDVALGILTDPLTYTGIGLAGNLAKAGVKGAEALAATNAARKAVTIGVPFTKARAVVPGSADAIEAVGKGFTKATGAAGKAVRDAGFGDTLDSAGKFATAAGSNVRKVFGKQRIPASLKEGKRASGAAVSMVAKASEAETMRIYKGLDTPTRHAISDLIDNIKYTPEGVADDILDKSPRAFSGAFEDINDQVARLQSRVPMHPDVIAGKVDPAVLSKAVEDVTRFQGRKYADEVVRGVMTYPEDEALRHGIFGKPTMADIDKIQRTPKDYLQRQFTRPDDPSSANFLAGRTIENDAQLLSALKTPGVKFERDSMKRVAERGQQGARAVGRAEIARSINSAFTNLADEGSIKRVTDTISGMDPESAAVATDLFNGTPMRGPVAQKLADINHVIKPMMVYGYILPKVNGSVRNAIGGVWSTASNPETRHLAVNQLKRLPSTIVASLSDAMNLKIGKDRFSHALTEIETAFNGSKGLANNAINALETGAGAGGFTGKQLADVVRSGALDGFTSTEIMLKDITSGAVRKKWDSIANMPGRLFRGVEDRMRAGLALDLMDDGVDMANAGRLTKEALYDYDPAGVANRTARDLIPFFQFMANAIPQQAKLLAENPVLAVALASLNKGADKDVYGYMEGQFNIPIGNDEEGNPEYLTSLGLPLDALNSIPNFSSDLLPFGRDVEQNLLGSAHPLIKTGYSAMSRRDPFFGSQYGSYSKLPGNIEAGEFGRKYNQIAGTGLTTAVDAVARPLLNLTDDRRSISDKLVNNLTGARVVSVDRDRARMQKLQSDVEMDPSIQKSIMPWSRSEDPATQALLQNYRDARKAARKDPVN